MLWSLDFRYGFVFKRCFEGLREEDVLNIP